jgi:hypothetical protein
MFVTKLTFLKCGEKLSVNLHNGVAFGINVIRKLRIRHGTVTGSQGTNITNKYFLIRR